MQVDVIVVGAGPGGSAAAFFLASAGAQVLLLDKAHFPRDKTCGDGLPPRAMPVLQAMGILTEVLASGSTLEHIEIIAPGGRSVKIRLPVTGRSPAYTAIVPRLKLDEQVRQRAVSAGAVFSGGVHVTTVEQDSTGVTVRADRGGRSDMYRARFALIATGASLRLLQTMGVLREPPPMMVAARAYYRNITALPDAAQFRFDGIPMPGYGWVFPLPDGAANVGAGFLPGPGLPPSPQSAFHGFIASSAIRRLLEGAEMDGPLKGYPLRANFAHSPTAHGERVLLLGEAAGLVNPVSGDGIDYALESGKMAAEYTLRLLAGEPSAAVRAAYDAALRAEYQALFVFCERVRTLFTRPAPLNLAVGLASLWPGLGTRVIASVLGGGAKSSI